MSYIQMKRRMQLEAAGFPFEGGCVKLPDGRVFIPNRDSVNSWSLELEQSYTCLESTFEILYQLDGDQFVLVEYDDFRLGDRCPHARALSRAKAKKWLIACNFPLPEVLQAEVRWATGRNGLSALLQEPRLLEKVRKRWPLFEIGCRDHVATLRDFLADHFRCPTARVAKLTAEQIEEALRCYIDADADGATERHDSSSKHVDEVECDAKPVDQFSTNGDGQADRESADLDSAATVTERTTRDEAIVIGERGRPCFVNGKEKPPLTDGQHAVIAALLKAGSEGMVKDSLEHVRPSARKILRTLSQDADWAQIIIMPGKTNGRYRLAR